MQDKVQKIEYKLNSFNHPLILEYRTDDYSDSGIYVFIKVKVNDKRKILPSLRAFLKYNNYHLEWCDRHPTNQYIWKLNIDWTCT